MTLLVIGVLLWIGAHWFKRLAPNARANLGDKGRGIVAILIVVSLILMIIGYRQADVIPVWNPPSFLTHINNLLMAVAIVIFATGHTKGRLRGRIRHPMLISVKTWAIAHLLVNGDLASIILFGGMLFWAVVSVIMINKSDTWIRPEPGEGGTLKFALISVAMFAVIIGIHMALGVRPFPG
jgi:uncharacterized membrane protein